MILPHFAVKINTPYCSEVFFYYEVIIVIYKRIRDMREDRDLTQEYIGKLLHVNQRTYSNYENGKRSISPEALSVLADFYETSVDYLMGRTDVKKPYAKGE